MTAVRTTISVVSHAQGALVAELLSDLERMQCGDVEVVLTLNTDEELPFDPYGYGFPLIVVRNLFRKGFGANHNAAFGLARGRYFCVVNPDVRLETDPLPALIDSLNGGNTAMAAPLVLNPYGEVEDSARRFPSPRRIFLKFLGRKTGREYSLNATVVSPDWVAGMFMLMESSVFRAIGGFDERYFLYYEDVELCARLRRKGYDIRLCRDARVIHDARRQSHREWRHRRWHLRSMLRFFTSPVYFMTIWQGRSQRPPARVRRDNQ